MLKAWRGALAVTLIVILTATPAQAVPTPREAVASDGGCAAFVVGQPEEVVSDATRDRLGLDGWPDGPFGITALGGGAYYFHIAAAFGGSDPSRPQRNVTVKGTLANPVRDGVAFSTQLRNVPAGYIWAGGGAVHRDPDTGVVLQTLHMERRISGDQFYAELHLGRLDPATGVTTYLGPVVQPDIPIGDATWNADLGIPQLTVVRGGDGIDYLHMYFADFRLADGRQVPAGLSVARAPVKDVIAAAQRGTVVAWHKYTGDGAWDQPAWGGSSADLNLGQSMAWGPQVVRSNAMDGYVMAAGVSAREIVLSTSGNGLDGWSARFPVARDPGYHNAYVTPVGNGPDPADLGMDFSLYYLQWPSPTPNWDNAHVMRRKVICADGLTPVRKPFTRYVKAGHHLVTTGTPPSGYTREGNWTLWSAPQPGTRALYGCRAATDDYFISVDPGCEGDQTTIVQTEGWIHTERPSNAYIPLYRCHIPGFGDHFVSADSGCEGNGVTNEGLLGFSPPAATYKSARHKVPLLASPAVHLPAASIPSPSRNSVTPGQRPYEASVG
ncbi:hypothetical protein AB0392_44720 [Nonomuraea angiospora]|uniref:hypothetical protein n=1 Tax=Nonomuraea angiospora TaxID=46172 RepID=UPI00344CD8EC